MSKPLIIITGASSSIGAAIAKRLSHAGYSLALLTPRRANMMQLNLPDAQVYEADVTNAEMVKTIVSDAEGRFGPCVGLINSAGFIKPGPFHEVAQTEHAIMVSVNIMGVINTCLAVLPGMRVRRKGTIININSTADRNARPQIATYAATKAAIKSLTDSISCSIEHHL